MIHYDDADNPIYCAHPSAFPPSAPYWLCWLLGCEFPDYYAEHCARCGEGYYDADWVHDGFVWRVRWFLSGLCAWFKVRRCGVCKRATGIGPKAPAVCDSEFCRNNWVPF